jgi:hypothetical protein
MVDSSWQYDKITGLDPNANPAIVFVSNIEVATSLQTITNLFILMNVLSVEILQLLFVIFNFLWA